LSSLDAAFLFFIGRNRHRFLVVVVDMFCIVAGFSNLFRAFLFTFYVIFVD
jgi:hypothetical protein